MHFPKVINSASISARDAFRPMPPTNSVYVGMDAVAHARPFFAFDRYAEACLELGRTILPRRTTSCSPLHEVPNKAEKELPVRTKNCR